MSEPGCISFSEPARLLQATLLLDPVVGCIDGGKGSVGLIEEFFREALGHEGIRMMLADQAPVGPLDLVIAGGSSQAEDGIGVILLVHASVGGRVAGPDLLEVVGFEAEDAGDPAQEIDLRRIEFPVGASDLEEAHEEFLEHTWLAPEEPRDLSRIGLKSMRASFGLIVDPSDIADIPVVDLEDAFEGTDLVLRDHAIDFGELGSKNDHSGCKGDPACLGRIAEDGFGRLPALAPKASAAAASLLPEPCGMAEAPRFGFAVAPAIERMPDDDTDQGAEGTSDGEADHGSEEFTPKAQDPSYTVVRAERLRTP